MSLNIEVVGKTTAHDIVALNEEGDLWFDAVVAGIATAKDTTGKGEASSSSKVLRGSSKTKGTSRHKHNPDTGGRGSSSSAAVWYPTRDEVDTQTWTIYNPDTQCYLFVGEVGEKFYINDPMQGMLYF
ncbi:hypothetical protein F503_00653 [Ophiostoma piceae UAMH 11346]|uniref:Uncharacterized protein n=1 Tax=Ophiostoma piceae (strain UAMH 11346) TaxID=1262450 RepID=S3C7L3_OPHP1|nr:hypothetical protein F503_00653 [Ophiostoma piceae UAMH 11346]